MNNKDYIRVGQKFYVFDVNNNEYKGQAVIDSIKSDADKTSVDLKFESDGSVTSFYTLSYCMVVAQEEPLEIVLPFSDSVLLENREDAKRFYKNMIDELTVKSEQLIKDFHTNFD